jgi:SAM-dependent methyltransferase
VDRRGRDRSARRERLSAATLGEAGDPGARAHYDDPAYYAFAYRARRQDVGYYTALGLRSGGPVLEYGIGSGRVALELARGGVEVVGVDLSRPMLSALRQTLKAEPPEVAGRVELRRGDMRRVRLGRRFPLVIAPFNVVLHLYTPADVAAFLGRVRQHLAPGGRFVFDFSVPQPGDLDRDPRRWFGSPRFRHPTTGELVRYAERFDYDPMRQLLVIWMRFSPLSGRRSWTVPLTHRQFFPQEMAALLRHAGFADVTFAEAFSGRAAGPDLDALVAICRVGRRRALAKRSAGR